MTGKPTKVMNHGRPRWKVEWRDEHGKRRQRFFPTLAEAKAEQDRVNKRPAVALHPIGAPGQTLAAYATVWLETNAPAWRPRTLASNRAMLDQHVLPFPIGTRTIGSLRLGELQRTHAKALVAAKRADGYAPDSVRLMFAALRAMLNEAAEDELIPVNPIGTAGKSIRRLLASGPAEERVKAMEADELRRFLKAAKVHSLLYPLYLAAAHTGMRLGELCGWQLDDLDLERREGHVRRSLGQDMRPRDPVAGSTKTKRSRVVDLSAELAAVLGKVKAERPALAMARRWRPVPPWVFLTRRGTPYGQRNVLRNFDAVLETAGLKQKDAPAPFSPHSLRHTFATLHLLHGTDRNAIQYVQQQLGHSSIRVTVDVYGSAVRMRDPAAADRLQALVASGGASGA